MAEGKDLLSELETDVLCPVCLEGYNEDEHSPKALPCQHSVCMVCLQKFIEAEEGSSFFKCPTCRENIRIPSEGAKGFVNNLTILSILGHLSGSSSKELNSEQLVKCSSMVCGKHSIPASHICKDCHQLLCYKCLGLIIKNESHKKHDVIEIGTPSDDITKSRLELQTNIDHIIRLKKQVGKSRKQALKTMDDHLQDSLDGISKRADIVCRMVKEWERDCKSKATKGTRKVKEDIEESLTEAEESADEVLMNLNSVLKAGDYLQCIQQEQHAKQTIASMECTLQEMEQLKEHFQVNLSDLSLKMSSIGLIDIKKEKAVEALKSPTSCSVLSSSAKGAKFFLSLSIKKIAMHIFPMMYDHQEVLGCVANGIPTVKSIVKDHKHQVVQEFALLFDKYHLMNETQINDISDNTWSLVIKPNTDVIVQQQLSNKNSRNRDHHCMFRTSELRKKLPMNTLTQYPMRAMTGVLLAANNDVYLQKETMHSGHRDEYHHHHHHSSSGRWFCLSIVSAVNPCDCYLLRDQDGQEERFNSSSGILTCVAPHRNYVVVLNKAAELINVYDEKGLFKKQREYKESYAKAMCLNEEGLLFIFHSLNYINILSDELTPVHTIHQVDLGIGDYPLTGISCGHDKIQVIFLSGYKKYGMASYILSCKG